MHGEEFKILFRYSKRFYKARVVKFITERRTAYAIRPMSFLLARTFGPQTLLFKEGQEYICESKINVRRPEYVEALAKALKKLDASIVKEYVM